MTSVVKPYRNVEQKGLYVLIHLVPVFKVQRDIFCGVNLSTKYYLTESRQVIFDRSSCLISVQRTADRIVSCF
jgi:hypothetical protein